MTNARFIPRALCVDPRQFGALLNIEWREVEDDDVRGQDLLGAAKLQHAIAVELRRHFAVTYGTVDIACTRTGLKRAKTQRMLRGESPIQTEDVYTYARIMERAVRFGL